MDGHIGIMTLPRSIDKTWSAAVKANWDRLACALWHRLKIDHLVFGPVDLMFPRELWECWAEKLIRSLADVCVFPPSRHSDSLTWASDGSMLLASAGILDKKSVTGAAMGSKSLVLKVPGHNISILHGEQIGLIIVLILTGDLVKDDLVTILTDHLNSVRLVDDSQTKVSQILRLRYMNRRSYYRWILSLIKCNHVAITYTKGHSNEKTMEARLNEEVDYLATSSQKTFAELSYSLIPLFFMNDYMLHSETDSWVESNTMHFVDILLERKVAAALGIGHNLQMSMWAHDPGPPPDFPYTKVVSAHSATVQLYVRSGQLATAEVLYNRGKKENDLCSLGCDATGDMHHIFVYCRQYNRWREDVSRELMERMELKVANMETEEIIKIGLLTAAKSLFSDDAVIWPLHCSLYYLGQIPNLDLLISKEADIGEVSRCRLRAHMASDWHTSSIQLTGWIFGDYQRRMGVLNNCAKR